MMAQINCHNINKIVFLEKSRIRTCQARRPMDKALDTMMQVCMYGFGKDVGVDAGRPGTESSTRIRDCDMQLCGEKKTEVAGEQDINSE